MSTNFLEFIEFTNEKVISSGKKYKMAIFKCPCGDLKEYDYYRIKAKPNQLCLKCSRVKSAKSRIKHNLMDHPLYGKWQDMKKRCYNPKVDRYKNYGALGITVCDEWKNNFLNFYNWSISNGWEFGLTIERKDNYKNYNPENCKYITSTEQGYNKKNTYYVVINEKKYSLAKLVNNNGISKHYSNIWIGLKNGKSIDFFY